MCLCACIVFVYIYVYVYVCVCLFVYASVFGILRHASTEHMEYTHSRGYDKTTYDKKYIPFSTAQFQVAALSHHSRSCSLSRTLSSHFLAVLLGRSVARVEIFARHSLSLKHNSKHVFKSVT